ncbi:Arc family DNA-binding protein [Xenorhabdus bovienii]|uniref:Arc family DNA-binding protein n=1 Tax=Xenorhabdus bovienii TaxID=40576 RepID=UPI0023B27004|nr:Arc family DNA-binding protein [Xenorhabdus bovienii]MDE9565893.1 Arc family DNA-binding protein [Xenorhabdus bovienii]
MAKYPSQMQDKFNLRFPDGMRDVIAERAKENGRSMNSEIIEMLKWSLNDEVSLSFPDGFVSTILSSGSTEKKAATLALLEGAVHNLMQLEELFKASSTDDTSKK